MAPSKITAVAHEGLTLQTPDGRPAFLAVVDASGLIIEAGPQVASSAWAVMTESYRNFLIGKGFLRVHRKPPSALR